MKYEQQVRIERSVPHVFDYMDDVKRESEWQPSIQEADKDPPGPTAVGTRKRYVSEFMGRRIENTYVTTVFVPNKRVVYETTPDSVLQARAELRFEPAGAGTRVTMGFEGKVTGPLRLVPRRLLERVYREEMESTLALLKTCLESSGLSGEPRSGE
ncbi:SRPBCC family protein [Gemmatimonadota bacterium]